MLSHVSSRLLPVSIRTSVLLAAVGCGSASAADTNPPPINLPSAMPHVNLPPVGLGGTSFVDGKAGPGVFVQQSLQYGQSNSGSPKVTAFAATPMVAYISDTKVLGANLGFEALLPFVNVDIDGLPGGNVNATRRADLILSPFLLQWEPVDAFGGKLWQRVSMIGYFPTGSYKSDRIINGGSNLWGFDPYYAVTWEKGNFEFSGRFNYAWFGKNTDPPSSFGNADSIQPGQAFHTNLAASYAVTDHSRLGVAGYILEQTTPSKVDGHDQPDSKERVMAIGPGFFYGVGRAMVMGNYYSEVQADNRRKSDQIVFRFAYVF